MMNSFSTKQDHLGYYVDVDGTRVPVEHPVKLRHVGKFFPEPGEQLAHLERFDDATQTWKKI